MFVDQCLSDWKCPRCGADIVGLVPKQPNVSTGATHSAMYWQQNELIPLYPKGTGPSQRSFFLIKKGETKIITPTSLTSPYSSHRIPSSNSSTRVSLCSRH